MAKSPDGVDSGGDKVALLALAFEGGLSEERADLEGELDLAVAAGGVVAPLLRPALALDV